MSKRSFSVDFSKKQGRLKPVSCINGAPLSGGALLPYDLGAEYAEIKPPLVRCVMPSGSYGYNQYLNIHAIFPDFSLDENDAESYNFAPTDRYLKSIKDIGSDIFLTLGESAEPYGKRLYTDAPRDKEKWARICEHIIAHYNEGFADGYKWNIKYAEIWPGGDDPDAFSGEGEELFALYSITARHLRARFPRLKIGGYGSLGFASLNRINASEKDRRAFEFMQNFFSYIRKEEITPPLDFFTWKCYAKTKKELTLHAKYARAYLDAAGLRKTKSVVCEFNLARETGVPPALLHEYPTHLSSALTLAEKSPIDMLFYSSAEIGDFYNALFTVDDALTHKKYLSAEIMEAYSHAVSLGTAVYSGEDYEDELYMLAAQGSTEGELILSCCDYSGRVEITLLGSGYTVCSVKRLASCGEHGEGRISSIENLKIAENKITVSVNKNEIFVINLF